MNHPKLCYQWSLNYLCIFYIILDMHPEHLFCHNWVHICTILHYLCMDHLKYAKIETMDKIEIRKRVLDVLDSIHQNIWKITCTIETRIICVATSIATVITKPTLGAMRRIHHYSLAGVSTHIWLCFGECLVIN